MTVSSTPPRVDPLVPLLCALATAIYVLHGFHGYLSRDLADYSYGGQQVAEGVPPYVAVINRAGPLAHLIPGIGALLSRWIGVDDVVGMRVFLMLFAVASIAATYLLGRDVFRSRLAGVAAAATLLGCQGFIAYASDGPREKTSMVLFLLCAILAMVHQRWLAVGFFTALATLTWQPVFFVAIAGAVAAVRLGLPTGRGKALLRVAVGGLVPSAVTVGAYAAVGALQIFMDNFVLINARYTRQSSPVTSPGAVWRMFVEGYGASLWLFLAGLVAITVLAVRALTGRSTLPDRQRVHVVTSGAMLAAGLAWSVLAFNGFPDAFILLPSAALGIGGVVAALAGRLSVRVALVASVAWTLVATVLGATYALSTRTDTLDDQRRSVDAVMDLLPPDARILSVEAPQPLVLADERNLSRLQQFGNGLIDYVDDTWPGGSDGYGRWIGRRSPTLIAVGDGGAVPSWLAPTVDGSYRHVGTTIGWDWYVNEDVGGDTRRALRRAVRDTYVPADEL
ncbi:MAG TPA: hypothetical protein VFT00_03035 [Nocardioides sp.]|nr:hypothetical protein [Nocardioides sp.]